VNWWTKIKQRDAVTWAQYATTALFCIAIGVFFGWLLNK
jgi:hypothetical protein